MALCDVSNRHILVDHVGGGVKSHLEGLLLVILLSIGGDE